MRGLWRSGCGLRVMVYRSGGLISSRSRNGTSHEAVRNSPHLRPPNPAIQHSLWTYFYIVTLCARITRGGGGECVAVFETRDTQFLRTLPSSCLGRSTGAQQSYFRPLLYIVGSHQSFITPLHILQPIFPRVSLLSGEFFFGFLIGIHQVAREGRNRERSRDYVKPTIYVQCQVQRSGEFFLATSACECLKSDKKSCDLSLTSARIHACVCSSYSCW